jgi:hypothetical protein
MLCNATTEHDCNPFVIALLPSVAAAPLAIVGIVLLTLGYVRRRSVDDT